MSPAARQALLQIKQDAAAVRDYCHAIALVAETMGASQYRPVFHRLARSALRRADAIVSHRAVLLADCDRPQEPARD